MNCFKFVLFLLALATLLGSGASAGQVDDVTEEVDAQGARELEVEFEFAAGELVIRGDDIAEAAYLEISYSPRWVSYDIDYNKRGSTGFLHLESDLRRNRLHDEVDNDWDVTLSTRYPMVLDIEVGACEADFDLGGLPIKELHLEIGATSGEIDFSKPNPERLSELEIETGASSLTVHNLGNANFEELYFEGGAASCELDFRGEFEGEAEVEIEVGLGSLDVIIPRDLAIRVETDDDNWFSSVDFHNLRMDETSRDIYESENFDDAKNRIIFYVDVGMGSVDFRGKR